MSKPRPLPHGKSGRPAYQPTDKDRATVKAMAGYGATQDEIALVLGCKDDTLRKYFRREWDLGAIEANTAMIQALYQNGVKHNNVQAQIFWAKTRCGFKETVHLANEDESKPLSLSIAFRAPLALAAPTRSTDPADD